MKRAFLTALKKTKLLYKKPFANGIASAILFISPTFIINNQVIETNWSSRFKFTSISKKCNWYLQLLVKPRYLLKYVFLVCLSFLFVFRYNFFLTLDVGFIQNFYKFLQFMDINNSYIIFVN